MKKLILILALSVAMVQVTKAEMFKFGIKGGIGFSKLSIAELTQLGDDPNNYYSLATGDGVMAYHVGVQARIKIAMFFVQPELYFKDAGGSVQQVFESGAATEVLNLDLKTVDLPILVGVKFGPLRINAGPVGTYVLTEESIPAQMVGAAEDPVLYSSGLTWGFQAGLGLDFSKITLDARYEGSLSKLGDNFNVPGVADPINLDGRPSQWVFSIGFMF